jgi:hypothetical protein
METIAEEILEKAIKEGTDVWDYVWDYVSFNPNHRARMDDAGGDLAIFDDGSALVWRGGSWELRTQRSKCLTTNQKPKT